MLYDDVIKEILVEGDHRNDHHLVKAAKKREEGNARIQILTLRPDDNSRMKMSGVLDITSVQITPLNRRYIRENIKLVNIIGKQQVVPKGSDEILTIDFSAVAKNKAVKRIACYIAKAKIYMIDSDGRRDIVMLSKNGDFVSLLNSPFSKVYAWNKLVDSKGYFKVPVKIFGGKGGGSIYSSSQGRKKQITYYEVTTSVHVKKFYGSLDYANIGEWSWRNGFTADAKGVTDAITRLSSKTTAMSLNKDQGCKILNYVVLFDKIGESDGSSVILKECVARNFMHVYGIEETEENIRFYADLFEGYLLQIRPYTVKASANVEDDKYIARKLKGLKILDVFVPELTEELKLQIMTKMTKGAEGDVSALDGYDGVRIIHDKERGDEYVGDMNAFKDGFDVSETDGINILAIAHEPDDWKEARTSAQLMKIVIRAIIDTKNEEFKQKYEETMKKIVRDSIDSDIDLEMDVKRKFRFENIDVSYINGLARELNPTTIMKHPYLFKSCISDLAQTLANRIMIDRYDQYGHSGMICVDRAFDLLKERALFVTKEYFEVYDPSANRYFKEMGITEKKKRRGVGQKYPSMGTRETSKLRFISDEELAERIKGLDVSEEEKIILAVSYAKLKEGAVCIPADLDAIAEVLAGSDEDGDKFVIFFQGTEYGIVDLIWDSGMEPRAVKIVQPKFTDKERMVLGTTSFIDIFAKNAEKENKDVGPITNAFRVVLECLLLDRDNPPQDKKDFFINMFETVFGAGEDGSLPYAPQSKVSRNEFGYSRYETCPDFYDRVMRAIRKMKPIWQNILLALDDLDVLGRHTQELTIDAQKKFYDVICAFIDNLRKHFSIIPLKFGVAFSTQWNIDEDRFILLDDRIMSENVIEIDRGSSEEPDVMYILPDAFSPIRRYAIGYALEKLNEYRELYVAAKNDPEAQEKRAEEYCNALLALDVATQKRLDHAIGMARTVNHLYGDKKKVMDSLYLKGEAGSELTREDAIKTELAIKNALHEEYDEIMWLVNNEIRKAAKGIDPDILVSYLAKSEIVGDSPGSGLSRMLKEETAAYLANHSEIRCAKEEIRIAAGGMQEDLEKVRDAYSVEVVDHTIIADDEPMAYLSFSSRVEDGSYETVWEDGKLYLTKPISEFINIPEADDSIMAFALTNIGDNWESGFKNFEMLPAGTHVKLEERIFQRNGNAWYRIYAVNDEGQQIAQVFCGPSNAKTYSMISSLYRGMEGEYSGVHMTEDNKWAIVRLDNVRKSAAMEELSDNIITMDTDIEEAFDTAFNEEEVDFSLFA